jgi:hypothetical protein
MKLDPKFNFKILWGAVMTVTYIGISYLVIFTPYLIPYNRARGTDPSNDENIIVRLILGIILFIYGIFRGYRIYKSQK